MKRSVEGEEVPLSALIDIVFLLIIFFIVTANIQREVIDNKIKLAQSIHVPPLEKLPEGIFTINVRKEKDDSAVVYSHRGTSYSIGTIKNMLVNMRVKYGDSTRVLIRASGDLPYSEIVKINNLVLDAKLFRVIHSSESKYDG
ncbi:MAG: biopolymer transporter ExbD [Lentisphaeria bacterium]|nr:biopolymer transporter ExbD [Lentisphaeria bacterium]